MDRQERNITIDAIKSIAIVLMVFGHCLQYGSGASFSLNASYFDNIVFKAIYSFHMPLFAAISGYLFYMSVSKKPQAAFKKQLVRLVIPIICWSVLYRVFILLVELFVKNQAFKAIWIVETIKYCFSNLWFLWAMFFCSSIVILIRRFLKDSILAYIFVLVVLQFVPNKYNFQHYAFMYPYFVGAYLFHRFSMKNCFNKRHICMLLVFSVIVWSALIKGFGKNHYIYTTGISLLQNNIVEQSLINAYRYFVGFVGTIMVVTLVCIVLSRKTYIQKAWTVIGARTMGIYILSCYLNIVLEHLTANFTLNYLWTLIETILITVIALGISYILERFTLTRKLLLGGH